MFGSDGERWIPVHGLVPHSRAKAAMSAVDAYMNSQADLISRHGIRWCFVALPAGRSAILIEPTLYWSDAPTAMQHGYLTDAQMAATRKHAPNPAARAAVHQLREGIARTFTGFGATHLQPGRFYPFLATRSAAPRALLQGIKGLLDPERRINPGALGL
jgi:hypothetical protein